MSILPIRRDPGFTHQIHPNLRAFVVTAQPNADGKHLARALCALFDGASELAGYDLIEDLTAFGGDISHADVRAISQCYAGRRIHNGVVKYTVLISPDEHYRYWTQAMDQFFPDRRHLFAPNLEAGWTELDRLRGR